MKNFARVKEVCLRDFLPNKRGFASEKRMKNRGMGEGLSSIYSIRDKKHHLNSSITRF
jgi:hypothetical protein